ncbi:MAG: zinc-ribbon domain-containing protein [Saccharofermentans sp.]|nr:zinc-ribbon domain-containing protein [Saccharofermentans sp.]
MFCMNCGLELPEDAKFCRKCAAPLTSCPECGEDIPKSAKYCWKCGKSLTSVALSGGLKEPEEPGSLLDEPENDPENVLPAKSDNASIFARMSSAKTAEAAHQNGAPSPFKQTAAAKRESSASTYSPAGMPSAFKPASEKKKKETEEQPAPAPSPYNRFSDAASPFKPLGSAKKETQPARPAVAPRGAAPVGGTRPAAPRGAASVGGTRPAAPRGAAAVSGSRPAAPRGAAAVAGSKPSSAFRPAAQAETKEAPAEKEAPAATRAASPSSPFKPLGSAKTETRTTRPAAAPRGAASVGGSRPAAPRGAAAVAGTRPAASSSAFRPAARPETKEETVTENEAPVAAPAANAAPAASSSPFKPLGSTRPAATAGAAAAAGTRPAAKTMSAFKPAPQAEPVKEPEIEEEEAFVPQPSAPVTFVPSGLFKPLEPEKTEAPAPKSDAALRAAASSAPASYSAFKPLGSTAPEEEKAPSAPQTPSPFASAVSSSPFASASTFSPLTSSEPDLEVPKKTFGFTAYRPGMSSSDDKNGDKKPVNPTAMFNMNSNSGAMSSLGEDSGSLSSLGGEDYLGAPNAGSLMSDGFEGSDEKLPQRTDDSHPRFFRRPAQTVTADTKAAPEPAPAPAAESNPLMPKAEPAKLRSFTTGSSPFKPASSAEPEEDKPFVREPGVSPFKPFRP